MGWCRASHYNPWKVKENPIIASAPASSANRWSALEAEVARTNVSSQEGSGKVVAASNVVPSENEPSSSSLTSLNHEALEQDDQ